MGQIFLRGGGVFFKKGTGREKYFYRGVFLWRVVFLWRGIFIGIFMGRVFLLGGYFYGGVGGCIILGRGEGLFLCGVLARVGGVSGFRFRG